METRTITTEEKNLRLDKYLRKTLHDHPLSAIYKLIRTGKIKVNNKKTREAYRLKRNDLITFHIPLPRTKEKTKPIIKKTFDITYEDENILIVNKPPFLASQPGTGVEQNNLINQVKTYLKDAKTKPALANRLDRGTSGLAVVGKNRQAILALYQLFKERKIKKTYLALVKGIPPEKQGTLRSFLRRITEKFQHKMIPAKGTEPDAILAETHYTTRETYNNYSLLTLDLTTGKMHQLRAQLQAAGHPIIGDPLYGNTEENNTWKKTLKRQFLHAWKLSFTHPFTGRQLTLTADLPEDLQQTLHKLTLQPHSHLRKPL